MKKPTAVITGKLIDDPKGDERYTKATVSVDTDDGNQLITVMMRESSSAIRAAFEAYDVVRVEGNPGWNLYGDNEPALQLSNGYMSKADEPARNIQMVVECDLPEEIGEPRNGELFLVTDVVTGAEKSGLKDERGKDEYVAVSTPLCITVRGPEAIDALMQLVKDNTGLGRFEGVLSPLTIVNDEEDDGKPAFDLTATKVGPSARRTLSDFRAGRKKPALPPASARPMPAPKQKPKKDVDWKHGEDVPF